MMTLPQKQGFQAGAGRLAARMSSTDLSTMLGVLNDAESTLERRYLRAAIVRELTSRKGRTANV